MEIISIEFLVFVLLGLVVFYLLPAKLQNPFLLLYSYYFYSTFAWQYVSILMVLTITNFTLAKLIHKAGTKNNRVLRLSIIFNLIVFTFYLTSDWTGPILSRLSGRLGINGINSEILVPLGFSYFILECISYLIDNSRNPNYPAHSLTDFALYLAYFPKRISGPIERGRFFIPQLFQTKIVDNEAISRSSFLVLAGLLRTMVFALPLTLLIPADAFTLPNYSPLQLIIWIISLGFILYNQFAGYTDIVRGVSGYFGIELSRNFMYPIFASDFSDFWKRWHATLSAWLRDYIFLPLTRALLRRNANPRHWANLIVPPMATMLASAVWHGGTPQLLLWGTLNGVYLTGEQILPRRGHKAAAQRPNIFKRVASSLILPSLALLAFLPFYFSFDQMKIILGSFETNPLLALDARPLIVLLAVIAYDWIHFSRNNEFLILSIKPVLLKSFLLSLVICAIIIGFLLQSSPSTFVYP